MSKWQPINTAPKNRRILLFCPGIGPVTGKWIEEIEDFSWGYSSTGHGEQRHFTFDESPTHWQELPEDPRE